MTDSSHPDPHPADVTLCPQDADTLDALMAIRATGGETGPMPADSAERADKLRQLFALFDADAPAEAWADDAALVDDDLVRQTVAAVDAARQRERFAQQVEILRQPRMTLGFSWQQGVVAAAAFLIAVSLLLPTLNRQRADAQRLAGMANLGRAGVALSSYAIANEGVMPKRDAVVGSTWWDVGAPLDEHGHVRSNSAHLFQLVRSEYVTVDTLGSPANPYAPARGELTVNDHDWRSADQISFSYQNQFTPYAVRIDDQAAMVILADKNPLFVPSTAGGSLAFNADAPLHANSNLHGGAGQNMLFANGAVIWSVRSAIENPLTGELDHIYTASGVTDYDGDELPTAQGDVQLVP
ncbi:MAG: hypothetical protein AAF078_07425 [Planctomycetota bacterium]